MSQTALDTLLADSRLPAPMATESDYSAAWRDQVLRQQAEYSPFALAVAGGLLADRLAWVFIAGYQAALRAVFPDAPFAGLACLAVSEDREQPERRPGVVWREVSDEIELTGHKSWIAACAQVDQLVVKARSAGEGGSRFVLLDRHTPGLILTDNPAPSMLPELSQGRAELAAVRVPGAACLDPGRIAGFARAEALHIYTAFLAMIWRQSGDQPALVEHSLTLLRQAAELDCFAEDTAPLAALNAGVQTLRKEVSDGPRAADTRWHEDQRLIAMYSRMFASDSG